MGDIKEIFNIYIDVVMLGIGLYMAFIQSNNLSHVNNMPREGQVSKVIGIAYIVVSVIGFLVLVL